MSLIFMDGFGHYNTAQIPDKWRAGAGADTVINTTPGVPRTGRGCLQIRSAAFGPSQLIAQTINLLLATNWSSNSQGFVMLLQNTNADVGFNSTCVALQCNGDQSLSVFRGPGSTLLGTTVPGIVRLNNTYNSIAMRALISATVGTVQVWCNGVLVLTLTGVNTTCPTNPALQYANAFTLMGPGGIPNCFHADVYALDCSVAPSTTFLGALRIVAQTPTANATPIQWTPLAGSNFQQVNEIPPDGDTSYNSSNTVGQTDQYQFPGTGIPANSTIFALQHVQDMRVDSGARSVASDVQGTIGTAYALSAGYVMYWTPYDNNPATGVPFVGADFPVNAGPSVTA